MFRKIFIVSIITLMAIEAFAQQDPQFTQNMFNRLYYNPAYAGSSNALCGTAIHRQQHTSFEGNPVTTILNLDASFNIMELLYEIISGIRIVCYAGRSGC